MPQHYTRFRAYQLKTAGSSMSISVNNYFTLIEARYNDDNMAVERALRPLTGQRKNSLFFCSTKGAKNSGIFNTFISTCKQKGRNFRDFMVDYVREYNMGNRDFVDLFRLAFSPERN